MDNPNIVTCTAPVNIAVVKYWGKRNEELILPINSSLSVTLHQDQLKTTTTVATSRSFQEDRIWLNGKEEDITHPRLQSCLREIRRLARKRRSDGDTELDSIGLSHKVHICSVNNFPTAAGLASSAAGFACLVYTLAKVFGVEGELSCIARQGSGSACRSMYGGFVQWIMGQRDDGKDSLAQQVEPESHWPELRILVLVASAEKKPVGSTSGMQTSVQTSCLLKHRAKSVVPDRMVKMIEAVRKKDFPAFAEITMKDSNQFHATCLDTYPPIFYLSSVSQHVISLVHRYNKYYGETRVSYTFDAGPNAVIFTLEQHLPEFLQAVQHLFPPKTNGGKFIKGLPVNSAVLPEELKKAIGLETMSNGISYVLSTKAGPGPCVVKDPAQHLLGSDGFPKEML
ncbi:diphosphomevalonate decarboxylase [Nelusetta ayraudi]|uniref:diphosphomevalonate decarboxylase n=1 Tax=Nelusetta ayraudi TaxID=303726 RepID=UPI003F7285E9